MRALEAVFDFGTGAGSSVELVLFALPQFVDAHPALSVLVDTRVAPVDGGVKGRRVATEATWLRKEVASAGLDLVHHAGGVVPPGATGTVTLTIHDLQPLDLPQNFSLAKRWYMRSMLGRSARRASVVAVPSKFTATRVRERFGLAASDVVVVPWCTPRVPVRSSEPQRSVGLGSPLFLYPAITYPHKQHEALVRAFARVASVDPGATLVCCGRPGPLDDRVRELVAAFGLEGRVHLLGRVGASHLDALYEAATAVVYPSVYEGFGLPVLEAMARGCPVIASDIPVLTEVAGDAAVLVDPHDLAGWAAAMQAVALDPARRDALSEAGVRRAALFDPTRTAAGLLGVWDRALQPPASRDIPDV